MEWPGWVQPDPGHDQRDPRPDCRHAHHPGRLRRAACDRQQLPVLRHGQPRKHRLAVGPSRPRLRGARPTPSRPATSSRAASTSSSSISVKSALPASWPRPARRPRSTRSSRTSSAAPSSAASPGRDHPDERGRHGNAQHRPRQQHLRLGADHRHRLQQCADRDHGLLSLARRPS